MTLNEILSDLNERIGSTPEVDNSKMTTWINQGLLAFCNTQDYHWLENLTSASTVADQDQYSLPTNCKRLIDVKIDDIRYKYVRYERRDMEDASTKYYYVLNNQLFVNPTPDTTSSNNIKMAYVIRPTKMTDGGDSPSDSDIAQLPEVYHEALVIYSFAIYNTYDEETGEALALMGNEFRPNPGTFYWFVDQAKKEENQRKKGQRTKMLQTAEYYGYSRPNQVRPNRTVLGN